MAQTILFSVFEKFLTSNVIVFFNIFCKKRIVISHITRALQCNCANMCNKIYWNVLQDLLVCIVHPCLRIKYLQSRPETEDINEEEGPEY